MATAMWTRNATLLSLVSFASGWHIRSCGRRAAIVGFATSLASWPSAAPAAEEDAAAIIRRARSGSLSVDRALERARSGTMLRAEDVSGISCDDFKELKNIDELAVTKTSEEVRSLRKLALSLEKGGDIQGSLAARAEADEKKLLMSRLMSAEQYFQGLELQKCQEMSPKFWGA
jgi:hypothetical protein